MNEYKERETYKLLNTWSTAWLFIVRPEVSECIQSGIFIIGLGYTYTLIGFFYANREGTKPIEIGIGAIGLYTSIKQDTVWA